jgi:hypothetical protein
MMHILERIIGFIVKNKGFITTEELYEFCVREDR